MPDAFICQPSSTGENPRTCQSSTGSTRFKWVNTVLGNLKTSFSGCDHALRFRKYGAQVLAAFAWRFNRRFDLSTLNERLLIAAAACTPRPQRSIRAADAHC